MLLGFYKTPNTVRTIQSNLTITSTTKFS